jgi:hypothetical protein
MWSDTDTSLPIDLRLRLLEDAIHRDRVTARRSTLLTLIWQESFLSGAGLISRTEALVGRGCFGAAPVATLRRDIHALKHLLNQAGFRLRCSRQTGRSGYYVVGRPELAPELTEMIRAGMQDVDPKQIALAARLTPADRVRQAGQLSDGLRHMAVRRLMNEQTGLSLQAALREVAHRYEQLGA